jgi:molecular chaperone GrpE
MSKAEQKEEKEKIKKKPHDEGLTEDQQEEQPLAEENLPDKGITEDDETDLKDQLDSLNDKYLRLYSDFDNYRRRSLKEILDIRKNAAEDVVVKLLPVLDDFERAITAFDATENSEGLKNGIILIYNKLMTILSGTGLEQMKTVGEPFNTDFHEAITSIGVPNEEMKNKVVDEIEKGYLLNGKVIRFAKVVVGS